MSLLKIRHLMDRGLSVTQAVDRVVVVDENIPADEWAEIRGVSERAVQKNVDDSETILRSDKPALQEILK